MSVYIFRAPDRSAIYHSWPECMKAIHGARGARWQRVASQERAEAMLYGSGVLMPPGTYWFTDGNTAGGVGIAHVEQGSEGALSVSETSTSVFRVFRDAGVNGLETAEEVAVALSDLRNILAEMAGLYDVLRNAPAGGEFSIVYDYLGVAGWLQGAPFAIRGDYLGVAAPKGGFRREGGPIISAIVRECRRLGSERSLKVTFQYQPAHQSTWCGRDDLASWNGVADRLATEGGALR